MQTEPTRPCNQILTIEARPRFTGFAVFEAPSRLLDYGTRKHGGALHEARHIAAKKLSALMDLHQPSVIVVRMRQVPSKEAHGKVSAILRMVRRGARKRSIPVHTIRTEVVRDFFSSHQCTSKHQRATLIAQWFPELSWKLPHKRKMWKSEDRRMVIFDAMAAALAFLNRSPPTHG